MLILIIYFGVKDSKKKVNIVAPNSQPSPIVFAEHKRSSLKSGTTRIDIMKEEILYTKEIKSENESEIKSHEELADNGYKENPLLLIPRKSIMTRLGSVIKTSENQGLFEESSICSDQEKQIECGIQCDKSKADEKKDELVRNGCLSTTFRTILVYIYIYIYI